MYHNNAQAVVLVIDSGIGGLSVVEHIKALTRVSIVYVADNAFFPYGAKKPQDIQKRLSAIIEYYQQHYQINAIVLACNTATIVGIDYVRANYKMPIVGIVPAIKTAAALTKSQHITLLATQVTASSQYVTDLASKFAPNCAVTKWGCPGLADWIETQIMTASATTSDIADVLGTELLNVSKTSDVIVLGCTHYVFAMSHIHAYFEREVRIIEPSLAVATRLQNVLNPTIDDSLIVKSLPTTDDVINHFYFTSKAQRTNQFEDFIRHFEFKRIDISVIA